MKSEPNVGLTAATKDADAQILADTERRVAHCIAQIHSQTCTRTHADTRHSVVKRIEKVKVSSREKTVGKL